MRWICIGILALSGCAVPVGNKGVETGPIGFTPTVRDIARDNALSFVSSGGMGLTLVASILALGALRRR